MRFSYGFGDVERSFNLGGMVGGRVCVTESLSLMYSKQHKHEALKVQREHYEKQKKLLDELVLSHPARSLH